MGAGAAGSVAAPGGRIMKSRCASCGVGAPAQHFSEPLETGEHVSGDPLPAYCTPDLLNTP